MGSKSPVTSLASLAALTSMLGVACSAAAPTKGETSSSKTGKACRFVLAPRSTLPARLPPVPPSASVRTSRIIVHAEAPLARIKNELEANIEPRLAQVRGASIGIGGSVNYTVDRKPFAVSVERDALVVRTDVRAHVEACSRGSCYASCNPTATARADIPLKLRADYRFAPSRVTTTFTRGCKIRTLGGFLTIDVTPAVESEISPVLRRIEQDIDRRLPDLRPEALRLWSELSKARPLPLVGCAVLQPRGIVQGPPEGTPEMLRMRFALLAAPEVRERCKDVSTIPALPPLLQDAALPVEDEVMLGLVSPLSTVASAFEAIEAIDVGGVRARVQRANVASAGSAIDADLSLQGDACGDVALRASPTWSRDGRAVELASPDLAPRETDRIAAASLEPKTLASAMCRAPRVGVLVDVQRIDDVLPALASSLSDESLDVTATITAVRPAGAAARGDDLVAWLSIRGQLALRQK